MAGCRCEGRPRNGSGRVRLAAPGARANKARQNGNEIARITRPSRSIFRLVFDITAAVFSCEKSKPFPLRFQLEARFWIVSEIMVWIVTYSFLFRTIRFFLLYLFIFHLIIYNLNNIYYKCFSIKNLGIKTCNSS